METQQNANDKQPRRGETENTQGETQRHGRERRFIFGATHAAVSYKGVNYDFSSDSKIAENREGENFNSRWVWVKSGSSSCTETEVRAFNNNWQRDYSFYWDNCQRYAVHFMQFLKGCKCPRK